MADESILSLLGTGGSVIAGGGVSAVVVRALFSSFSKRLDDIDGTLKKLVEKSDERHEKLIERLASVEAKADAAHRRLDEGDGPPRKRR